MIFVRQVCIIPPAMHKINLYSDKGVANKILDNNLSINCKIEKQFGNEKKEKP